MCLGHCMGWEHWGLTRAANWPCCDITGTGANRPVELTWGSELWAGLGGALGSEQGQAGLAVSPGSWVKVPRFVSCVQTIMTDKYQHSLVTQQLGRATIWLRSELGMTTETLEKPPWSHLWLQSISDFPAQPRFWFLIIQCQLFTIYYATFLWHTFYHWDRFNLCKTPEAA